MFKSLKAAFGVGGPQIDTIVHTPRVAPGQAINGVVTIRGGDNAREVNSLSVALTAVVEVESGDDEYNTTMTVSAMHVAGRGQIAPGMFSEIPFTLPVPWETPFNCLGHLQFHNMRMGVQTRLDMPGLDARDFDPVQVIPLPVHEAAIHAVEAHGFQIKSADLERGNVLGSTLGFYNEIEFRGHGRITELELTFVTRPDRTDILIEADRRGLFSSGDHYSAVTVPTNGPVDWNAVIGGRIAQLGGGVF